MTSVSIEQPSDAPRRVTDKTSPTKTVDLALDLNLKQRMNLVVVGHVDHGKSTVVGRLLSDTNSLPEGKLEAIKAKCDAAGKRFEYAFLLDALVDEQAQGITIDTARIFFQTAARHYIILDAPGHIEFLRNMITGASHAEAALLVIDAEEGVRENSRRHGSMLALLGVKHLIVLINKMDLVKHSEDKYKALVAEYSEFLSSVGSTAEMYIPISGLHGENITAHSPNMPWYKGPTVLEALDQLESTSIVQEKTLRMYVQDIYKFTKYGDERRIIAGTIDSGSIKVGDKIVFYPSGKKTEVSSIESFNTDRLTSSSSGEAVGFTMKEQLYLSRGELAIREGDRKPAVSTRAQVSLFWLGSEPLSTKDEFTIKIGTAKVSARIEKINKIVDAGNLTSSADPEAIEKNNVAECVLRFAKPLAFDEVEFLSATSRFVLVHNYRIWGGGIIRKSLEDERVQLRQRAQARDEKWIRSLISPVERAERYAQRPTLILITGAPDTPRRELGKALEAQLFREGRIVYFMGIGNILHGLDSDLEGQEDIGQEHIRRVAELGNIMLDTGLMLIVSAANLSESDISLVQELVGGDRVKVIVMGNKNELTADVELRPDITIEDAVKEVKSTLSAQRYIFGF
jgi:bifunctional enzyme CysN/CysC